MLNMNSRVQAGFFLSVPNSPMNACVSGGSVSVLLLSPHCVLPFLVIWWEARSEDGRCPVLLVQPHLARSWYRGLRNGDFSSVLSAIWLLKLCLESVEC